MGMNDNEDNEAGDMNAKEERNPSEKEKKKNRKRQLLFLASSPRCSCFRYCANQLT